MPNYFYHRTVHNWPLIRTEHIYATEVLEKRTGGWECRRENVLTPNEERQMKIVNMGHVEGFVEKLFS
jgi:hypothetical protein